MGLRVLHALTTLGALVLMSNCAMIVENVAHEANRRPCDGLPSPMYEKCLDKRGEDPPLGPGTGPIDPSSR